MKIESIREMTPAELNSELLKLKNELFNLRFQHGSAGKPCKNEGSQKRYRQSKDCYQRERTRSTGVNRKEDKTCRTETAERLRSA